VRAKLEVFHLLSGGESAEFREINAITWTGASVRMLRFHQLKSMKCHPFAARRHDLAPGDRPLAHSPGATVLFATMRCTRAGRSAAARSAGREQPGVCQVLVHIDFEIVFPDEKI
jgi:hypothetical protein